MTTISRHRISASIVGGASLAVKAGDITLDEGWSPYCQVGLTTTIPDDLDTIDPTTGVRVRLAVAQDFGESQDIGFYTGKIGGGSIAALTARYGGKISNMTAEAYMPWNSFGIRSSNLRTMNLGLRARARTLKTAEVALTLSSDEALLQDYGLVATTPFEPNISDVRELVVYVLSLIGALLQPDDGATAVFDAAASTWLPGQSAWDYLAPLIQKGALRLWCDELRRWHLTTDDLIVAGAVALSDTGTMTDHQDTIDRDGSWFDAVVITYTWTDEAGASHTAYDAAGVEGYSKVKALSYDTVYPGPGAAQRVLNRALGHVREQTITAINDYSVTPGQPVTVSVPDTAVQTGFVASVHWQFGADEMEVKTRGLVTTPPTAYVFGPVGVSYLDVPSGISYEDFDWTDV